MPGGVAGAQPIMAAPYADLQRGDARKDVQNIELMNLAGFCRNCLAKWYAAAAAEQGVAIDYDQARERVYGMPYAEWKALYQTEAT